ncbi:MAG TPA: conjugative transposon protein TraM [Mucilaginibacter sp.]|nr:conjugative transposon protein TraM [Mucilaginibacter sp.]
MKKKIIFTLPLLVVLLATIAFAALRGPAAQPRPAQGLNTRLPGAAFDQHEKPRDKMSFYDQAKLDSSRQQSADHNPLVQQFSGDGPTLPGGEDPAVSRINEKLAAINQQVSQPQPQVPITHLPASDPRLSDQVDRLEGLMQNLQSKGPDPEMQQLSTMLAQIQAIQHPEKVPAVKPDSAASPFRTIPAIIDGKQKIKQSGAVQLKLTDSLSVQGQLIPAGTLVFGSASISQQRLLITIKNIRLGRQIIPVDLVVYAMDGMPGVPAPEAELGEAAADGAAGALQNMQFLSLDQSLATQAASSGINAARALLSKKVKRITVHLKDGEPVLLRNNRFH